MHWKSHHPPCSSILCFYLLRSYLAWFFFHARVVFLSFSCHCLFILILLLLFSFFLCSVWPFAFLFSKHFQMLYEFFFPTQLSFEEPAVLFFSLTQIYYWFNSRVSTAGFNHKLCIYTHTDPHSTQYWCSLAPYTVVTLSLVTNIITQTITHSTSHNVHIEVVTILDWARSAEPDFN